MPVDPAIDSTTTSTTPTTCYSLRGRGLTLRLGGRGGLCHLTTRVCRYVLRNATVCGLLWAELPTARDGRRTAELGGYLLVVDRFVLVGPEVLVFGLGLPVAEVVFGVVEDLAGLGAVGVGLALVSWNDGAVVQKLEETAAVAGQDDLLLGALDRGEEFGVVGFLELLTSLAHRDAISFLAPHEGGSHLDKHAERQEQGDMAIETHDIRQLSLGNQVLRLGPDELLLKDDKPGALGLLGLDLGDLIRDLALPVAAGLDALLGVADLLHGPARVVEGVGVVVLLLADLAEDDADLVADVADGLVARLLAPLGQLARDADALLARGLVRADDVVGRLDQLVQLARQLRLDGAAQRGQREAHAVGRPAAAARGRAGGAAGLAGADGEIAVPSGCSVHG